MILEKKNKFMLVFLIIFLLFFYVAIYHEDKINFKMNILNEKLAILGLNSKCNKYKQECLNLFSKLRFPNQSLIMRPPPRLPPKDLYAEFTQNGEMPITKEWYINEVYTDSNTNSKNPTSEIVTKKTMDDLLDQVKQHQPLNYGNTELQRVMTRFKQNLTHKSMVIIGTQIPWIEAISYYLSASKITTLDYTRKKYADEYSSKLEWIHVNDYLDYLLNNNLIELFDNSASFSSIEHSGLGRYGDPLSPNGDIEAVKQVHCLLKPNGLFFLGLPSSTDNSSYIEFNAHRIYGYKRLNKLFNTDWTKIEQIKCHDEHSIYVLRKNDPC